MTSTVRAAMAIALVSSTATVLAFRQAPQVPPARDTLLTPAALTEKAPAVYTAAFDTSAGAFTVQVTRAWAPNGADRFYNLVKAGFYNEARIFRVVPGFVVQFGLNGNPAVSKAWDTATIKGERSRKSNTRGRLTFGMANGINSRSTQVFVNLADNSHKLDADGFAPFGDVVTGMDLFDRVYSLYGEAPDQKLIMSFGNAYLTQTFPKLDYIRSATIR